MAEYYRLNNDIGLRGWDGVPYALRHFPTGWTEFIGEEFFRALSFCDGGFDCASPILLPIHRQLIGLARKNGAVVPCEKGEGLTDKQKYKLYPCKYIETAHWSITGKCNMLCRHCFLSAPQAKYGEISTEMALLIIDMLAEAGISMVNLTGGEPLVRQDFWQLVDALRSKDIVVEMIYTNGLSVDDALLDGLEERGMKPDFSLSFDGKGWHDWMRGLEGAEDAAIRAIKLLVSRDFTVSIESAFHRDSIGTIGDTMRFLAELGVRSWKTNPAAASGNWLGESRDLDLTVEELYDAYLGVVGEYFEADSPLGMQLGGFFVCRKGKNDYDFPSKKPYKDELKRLEEPLCMSARKMMYISADAKLLPCIPLSGMPIQDEFPSLYDMTIIDALSSSLYLDRITAPVKELLERQPGCAACQFRLHCNGGCRAAALMESDGADYYGVDSWTCHFYMGGFEEKIHAVAQKHGISSDGA